VQHADREAARLAEQETRLQRDYLAGELGAASFEVLSERVAGELTAAKAEHARLATHAERVNEAASTVTSDQDVLRRVHDLYGGTYATASPRSSSVATRARLRGCADA
jgi:hypothetical protein